MKIELENGISIVNVEFFDDASDINTSREINENEHTIIRGLMIYHNGIYQITVFPYELEDISIKSIHEAIQYLANRGALHLIQ